MADSPDLPKMLGQQLGPLPVAGWAAAIVGGLGVAWYMARKKSAAPVAAPTPSPQDAGYAGVGGGNIGLGGVALLPNGAQTMGTLPATASTTPGYTSNSDWATAATRQLIASNYDPLLVSRSLTDYINGTPLDYQESQVIELALKMAGPPPSPVASQPAPLPPSPSPAAPQAKMIAAPKYPTGVVNGFNPADPDPSAQYFCPVDYGDSYVLRKNNGFVACMTLDQAHQIDGLLASGKQFPLP